LEPLCVNKNTDGNAPYAEPTKKRNADSACHEQKKARPTNAGFAAKRFYLKNKTRLSTFDNKRMKFNAPCHFKKHGA